MYYQMPFTAQKPTREKQTQIQKNLFTMTSRGFVIALENEHSSEPT